MKLIKTLTLVLIIYSLSNVVTAQAASLSIQDRSPDHNGLVEKMKVVLSVNVTSDNKPVSLAWVHFYMDGEWIGVELSEANGRAAINAGKLDDFGYHKWNIRVEKNGYTKYLSPEWRFKYQPRPRLQLLSDYGETFGEGNYTYGEEAIFGLTSTTVQVSPGERYVFERWMSYQENGYSGNQSIYKVSMNDDIREFAEWRREYYLDMNSSLPRFVYPKSGWYPEGSLVQIRVNTPEGATFLKWNGSGDNSYSGFDENYLIRINGSIQEKAIFNREKYTLKIESDRGSYWGGGQYPAWENASFGVDERYIYISNETRYKFTGWKLDNGKYYDGNNTSTIEMSGNLTINAGWIKQHYVAIYGDEGGTVNNQSGWLDENNAVKLQSITYDNYTFTGWEGLGDGSYTGPANNYTIIIRSPIIQHAKWRRQCQVKINSEFSTTGQGYYLEGEKVAITATKAKGLFVRKVFKEWTGDIYSDENPFNFTINKDMNITATYEKNYNVFIGALLGLLILVGAIFLRMLNQ